MAVLPGSVFGQTRYPVCISVVSCEQKLGVLATGVGVGVAVSVADDNEEEEDFGGGVGDEVEEEKTELKPRTLAGVGDGKGTITVGWIPEEELVTENCKLAEVSGVSSCVGVTLMMMLDVGVGSAICKSLTAVPLEQNTDALSVTSSEGELRVE